MGLGGRDGDLVALGVGEDVVAHDVVAPVVLVVAAVERVEDEVVLHDDAFRTLVVVETPAAVIPRLTIHRLKDGS